MYFNHAHPQNDASAFYRCQLNAIKTANIKITDSRKCHTYTVTQARLKAAANSAQMSDGMESMGTIQVNA